MSTSTNGLSLRLQCLSFGKPHPRFRYFHFNARCRHRNHVQNTFAVHPVYLKSENEEIPAFRHWGMQLSRRPACLKAYFVMRTFGLKQMQKSIRQVNYLHKVISPWFQLVRTCDTMRELVEKDGRFGIVGKPVFTLFAFNVKVNFDFNTI